MRHKFGLKMVPMVIVAILLFTLAIMLLWNWVLVPVLGVSTVTYWQAMGIGALSRLLFGGGKGKGKYYGRHRHHCWGEGDHKHRWKEKMENLSDEEKEKMKDFFGKFSAGDKAE